MSKVIDSGDLPAADAPRQREDICARHGFDAPIQSLTEAQRTCRRHRV